MSTEMNLMQRLKGPTPPFFKRVANYAMSLAAAGGAVLGAEAMITDFHLPALLYKLCQWLVVGGLVAGAVSKTTVNTTSNTPYSAPKDAEQQNK
jgi:hypothetical protein